MQNFTLRFKGKVFYLFALSLIFGTLSSYGQVCATVTDEDSNTAGNQQSFCYLETVDDIQRSGTNTAIFETADTENDTDPINDDELLTNGVTYFVGSTTEDCERVAVSVTVNAAPTPENTIFPGRDDFSLSPCISSNFTAGDLEDEFIADTDYQLEVYEEEFGTTPLPDSQELTPGQSYFVGQVSSVAGNCPSTRAAVGYSPTEAPTPSAEATQTLCEGATVADLVASGTEPSTQTIRWYRSMNSNSPLADDVELINGEDYFATQIVNDRNDPFPPCETRMSERARVVVELANFEAGPDVSESICQDDLQTRLETQSPTAVFLSLVAGRDLPSNVSFSPSIQSIVTAYSGNPFQTFTTLATFTTEEGCIDTVEIELTVFETFEAGENSLDNTLCRSDLGDNITTAQVEAYLIGLLSDDADQNGEFSPLPSAIADDLNNTSDEVTFNITYTVGDGTSCEDSANLEVTVFEGADFELVELAPLCNDDIPALVNAIPEDIEDLFLENFGGNVPSGQFEAGAIQAVIDQYNQNNIDTFTATFIANIDNGCSESIELSRTVIEGENANAGSFDNIQNVCSNEESIDLTLLNNNDSNATAGGTFSGEGVSNNSFDPSTVAPGNVTITYTVDDSLDCVSGTMETTFTIEVIQGRNAGQDISGTLCLSELEDIVLPNIQNPENIIPALFGRFDFNGETGGTIESNLGNDFDQIGASLFAFYTNPNRDSSITIEGQYTVGNDTDNCGSDVSNFAITIIDGDLVDAGSDNTDNTLCNADIPGLVNNIPTDVENLYFDLLEAGVPQNGTFNPSIEELIADYNSDNFQTFSTTYTIGTEGCGDSVELAITVVEPGQAIAEANDDIINVCSSETSFNLNAALSENSTLGGTFFLNEEEFEGNIFDASTVEDGVYSFTYTVSSEDADCIEGSATANFTIDVTSDFDFGNDITTILCDSEVPDDLDPSTIDQFYMSLVAELPSGGTFETSAEDILTQYNNNPIDTFTRIYTVSSGECQGSVTVSVTIQEEGPANAGDIADQTVCSDSGMINLADFLTADSSVGGTFSGEGVENNMFGASMEAGDYLITYSVTDTAPCVIEGTESSTTFSITIVKPGIAIAEAANDYINICTSENSYDLNDALSQDSTLGGTFVLNGEEFDGNIFDATMVENGEYVFTYNVSSDDADCIEGSASADFTINVTSETFDAGEDVNATVCSVGLDSNPTIVEVRNYFLNILSEGVPTDGTFNPSIEDIRQAYLENQIGTFATTYTVGNGGCEDSVELVINVVDEIPAELGTIENPAPICRNAEDVDLFSYLPEGANLNGTFEGYEDGTFSPTMMGEGDFEITYTLTEDSPCTTGEASATFTITVQDAAFAGMDMDIAVCQNDGVQNLFDFLSVDADTDGEFTLEDGTVVTDGMMDPSAFDAGTYTVTYTVAAINDCGDDTAEFTITVQEVGDAPVVGDATFCAILNPTGADLTAGSEDLTFYTDADLTMLVADDAPLTEGTYYVTQRGDAGCESVATMFNVSITDPGTPTIEDANQTFCQFDDPTIADLNDAIDQTSNVTWYASADSTDPLSTGTALQDGVTYFASLYDPASDCDSSQRLAVNVSLECDFFIPEGISPNGDQLNDDFEIRYIEDFYPNYTIEIYNRWGDSVYKGNANTPNWDGTSNQGSFGDGLLPVGVYFYYLDFKDGSTEPRRGKVYLSR